MKNILTHLRAAAIAGSILVFPLLILDFMFNMDEKLNAFSLRDLLDTTVLFGILWLLSTAFTAILKPLVRSIRAGSSIWRIRLIFRSGSLLRAFSQ